MGKQEEDGKEEDERREAAIASIAPLQRNFKPTGVTQDQLSKFQELHKRRLQIKSKSKIYKKTRDFANETGKAHQKDLITKKFGDKDSSSGIEEPSSPDLKNNSSNGDSLTYLNNEAVQLAPKKRQKLHWGLDAKERWERKANM